MVNERVTSWPGLKALMFAVAEVIFIHETSDDIRTELRDSCSFLPLFTKVICTMFSPMLNNSGFMLEILML